MYMYVHIVVATRRQDSMSPARANAVLSKRTACTLHTCTRQLLSNFQQVHNYTLQKLLPCLESLDLSYNYIETIEHLTVRLYIHVNVTHTCTYACKLHVHVHGRISYWQFGIYMYVLYVIARNCQELPHLKVVDLSHNKVSSVRDLHLKIGNLSKLGLAHNQLTSLEGTCTSIFTYIYM